MSPLILTIVILYLVLTIGIGMVATKRTQSASSFHGAKLGVVMCVAAGTGEWLGGTATTGISEYGYDFGIAGAWYTIANGIGIIFLALFFAKLYRSLETVTVPGILGHFIGPGSQTVSSILLTFVMLAVGTSQVVAIGSLGVVFGLDYVAAVIVLGGGFILYTLAGGMIAVGYTNVLHLIAMYAGVLLAVLLIGGDVGGLAGMQAALPQSYFSIKSIGMPKVFSWILASLLGACTAQAGIQPILAAKDVPTARRAAFITAILVAPFGLLTAFLGMAAKVRYPGLASGKQALPTLMMALNPVAGGIVLASILAAVLSTISPIILASGTMLTKDIYQRKLRPDADDRTLLRVSRLTTAGSGMVCILAAILLYDNSRILDLVYFAYTLRGCLFVVLLLGIYWHRTSDGGGIRGMVATTAVGFFWVAYKAVVGHYPIHPNLNETYISILAALCFTVLFSLLHRTPQPLVRAKFSGKEGD